MRISVLGAGSWGTALSIILQSNGHDVTLWEYKRGYYKTKQPFRLYETPEEGLSDYFNFLEVNKRYAPLKGMKDASTAIDFLAKSGYASDTANRVFNVLVSMFAA